MAVAIHQGDALTVLRTLPDESVHCVVTSPPYWGLRDYGVDGQIGLERALGDHLAVLVSVFQEVRRVLRKDGTCWINYGDAYASTPNGRSAADTKTVGNDDRTFRDKPISTIGAIYVPDHESGSRVGASGNKGNPGADHRGRVVAGGTLKPKDRMLLPARVAIALQDDGWWVRDEIIWHKPNPMPSSVKDRTTPAHEMIYMLSKSPRYWFDFESFQEPASGTAHARRSMKMPDGWDTAPGAHGNHHRAGREKGKTKKTDGHENRQVVGFNDRWDEKERKIREAATSAEVLLHRNRRSVWTVPPKAFKEAHFATFPPALIEPCIKAGCPPSGVVLDPFFGAGTTGLVCQQLGRDCIGIELNPAYVEIAKRRLGLLTLEDLCA